MAHHVGGDIFDFDIKLMENSKEVASRYEGIYSTLTMDINHAIPWVVGSDVSSTSYYIYHMFFYPTSICSLIKP